MRHLTTALRVLKIKMFSPLSTFLACVFILSRSAVFGEVFANSSAFYKLQAEILKGYSTSMRPVRNISTVTNITVKFYLRAIEDVYTREQKISQTLYLYIRWQDEFLQWIPDQYDGATDIVIKQKEIWVPDLVFGPSTSGSSGKLGYDDQPVRVMHNGTVLWAPEQYVETSCIVSITNYPLDKQSCRWDLYLLVSDTRHAEIFSVSDPDTLIDSLDVENAEWKIVEISDDRCNYTDDFFNYSCLTFTYTLQRRSVFLMLTMIVPTLLLAVLSTLVFALPADCGEKISLGVTLVLTFVSLLSIVMSVLPQSSLQISVFVVYLVMMCACSALSVLLTVLVLSLHHRPDSVPLPSSAVNFVRLLHSCGRILLSDEDGETPHPHSSKTSVSPLDTQQGDVNGERPRSSKGRKLVITWRDVAVACDYVFFRLFLFIVFLATVICFCIMAV